MLTETLDENKLTVKPAEVKELRQLLEKLIDQNILNEEYQNLLSRLSESFFKLSYENDDFRLLLASSHDVIFRISQTGKITYISPACEKLLDYTSEEMVGKSISNFISAEKLSSSFKSIVNQLKEKNLVGLVSKGILK